MESPGTLLVLAFGVANALFWAVVGWRAMVAHEAISKSLEKLARRSDAPHT